MSGEKILAATYRDKVTVYRNETYTDPDTWESRERENPVYEQKPCALSSSKNDAPSRGAGTYPKEEEYVLFAAPDIRMQANDRAVVLTEAGETYEGRTGRTLVYAGSHGETKLKVEGIA